MTLPKGFGSGGNDRYAKREVAKKTYEPRKPKIKTRKTNECENCAHTKYSHKKGIFKSPCKVCMCPKFKAVVLKYEAF